MKFIPISDSLKLSEKLCKNSSVQSGHLKNTLLIYRKIPHIHQIPIMDNRQLESVRKLSPLQEKRHPYFYECLDLFIVCGLCFFQFTLVLVIGVACYAL